MILLNVFVAMVLFSTGTQAASSEQPDHSLFTDVLRDHVKEGVSDYKSIKTDARFEQYIRLLMTSDPSTVPPGELLSYWLNVYNAFTIKVVIDHYPLESITDLSTGGRVLSYIFKTTVWDKEFVEINGKKMTLNHIEHDIVRPMGDARAHFGLVCASKGCPPLRSEAFDPARLAEQLDDQGRKFMSQAEKNYVDISSRKITISKIFDWFEGDFERDSGSVIRFIARFVPAETATFLLANEADIDIDYSDYDWSLNE